VNVRSPLSHAHVLLLVFEMHAPAPSSVYEPVNEGGWPATGLRAQIVMGCAVPAAPTFGMIWCE
jgi:hypothetical protein